MIDIRISNNEQNESCEEETKPKTFKQLNGAKNDLTKISP